MPERDPNGDEWTLKTLRVLIEANDLRYSQRFAAQSEALSAAFTAQQNAVNAALTAADRAVLKAESASEKRFDAVNEFRASLADQSRLLMPRAESEQASKTLKEQMDKLEKDFRERSNITAGVKEGTRENKENHTAIWTQVALVIAILGNVVLTLYYVAHWGAK
jgi:hypothetical protein